MRRLVAFLALLQVALCHCPHMGQMPTPTGPSPPSSLPQGDNGWDYDPTAAPGILPDEHFIQTTHVYRNTNEESSRMYSGRVVNTLRELRERLGKSARLILENENIECAHVTDHFRCADFPQNGAYNYIVIEDEKNGAAVYEVEQKYNAKSNGAIEMAILDSLSRHSPYSLTMFASRSAEKEVGFVRALSTKEINALSQAPTVDGAMERFSPLELNLLDPQLLELRNGEGLENVNGHRLVVFDDQQTFDKSLAENKFVFVLFWNNVHMASLHVFNMWARVSKRFDGQGAELAHVACHLHGDFCSGLKAEDFQTIVAYKDGKNVGSTAKLGDEEFYLHWMSLMQYGPLIKLENATQIFDARKCNLLGKERSAVTIGVFPSEESTEFKHFRIAAEKLSGRYFVAYAIGNTKQQPTVSTYRRFERQKRVDSDGRFDPASLISFIERSSAPSVIDIDDGFTTNALLRQRRAVVVLVADAKFDDASFQRVANRQEAKIAFVFARLHPTDENVEIRKAMGIAEVVDDSPRIVVVNKDRVHFVDAGSGCPEKLLYSLQKTKNSQPDYLLATREPHPLRVLQAKRVNQIFGAQNTIVLADHTLYLDADTMRVPIPTGRGGGGGGCPFMQGPVGEAHEEL